MASAIFFLDLKGKVTKLLGTQYIGLTWHEIDPPVQELSRRYTYVSSRKVSDSP
jgi:hypothetical protein